MKARLLLLTVLLSLSFILAGCGDVVAVVNGEEIKKAELDKLAELYIANYQSYYQQSLDPYKDKKIIEDIRKMALEDLIKERLLLKEAEKRDIEVTEKELQKAYLEFKKRLGGDSAYQAFLGKLNMTDEEWKKEVEKQIVIDKLRQEVVKSVTVSAEEVRKYYDEHPFQFGNLREVKVSHILVASEEEAYRLIQRVKRGEDFAALAKQYSLEPAAQKTGGNLGFINENSNLVEEFKEAALQLKAGQVTSKPVKTEFGYHVIKAFAEKPQKIAPFEKVELTAKSLAQEAKQEEVWQAFVDGLRKMAKIKLMEDK